MNLWGLVMIAVGCFLFICATMKSEFFVYRLFVARSRMMWKQNVHRFLQFAGLAIIVAGALVASGILSR